MEEITKITLNELLQQQGKPSVSITLSVDRKSFADKDKIRLELKNQIDLATKKLHQDYDENIIRKLIHSLDEMARQVDVNHLQKGIGIYVSPDFKKLVSFPFKVSNKVVIDPSFDIVDIQEMLNKMVDYTVLLLSKHKTRLFKGKGNRLEEINDSIFPMSFENEFQIHRTSPHSYYNEEESQVDQARVKAYFRKIDKMLDTHVKETPIVLIGVTQHLSEFKSISKHTQFIIAELTGNYDKASVHEISKMVWPEVEQYSRKEKLSK